MWLTATYVLLLMACTEDGATCSPPLIVPGFVSQSVCMEAARSIAPLLQSDPSFTEAKGACVRAEIRERSAAAEGRHAG